MKDFKFAVFIGRFQPFHNGHLAVIEHGLKIAEKVIVVVGSTQSAPTVKNPLSFDVRKQLILDATCKDEVTRIEGAHGAVTHTKFHPNKDRIIVVGVRDYYYNENTWISDIQAKTDEYIQEGDAVALLGDYKDGSSYYLKYFPQWEFTPMKWVSGSPCLSATDIREHLFTTDTTLCGVTGVIKNPASLEPLKSKVPANVVEYLEQYVRTYAYRQMCLEQEFVNKYKAMWANAPFPPTFVTVDAVVVCSGHVLLVKRKFNPGEGLYALPGGFIKPDELIRDAMLRELKEETGIRVDKLILQSSIVDSRVFDHPNRSLRGRTITHGFYLKLKDGKLPEVRGNDDAASAKWVPLADFFQSEPSTFEDHFHIVHYFVNRGL